MLSFSVESNVTNLVNTDKVTDNALSAIHGLKFLSMSWVIIGHSYLQVNWQIISQCPYYFFLMKKLLINYYGSYCHRGGRHRRHDRDQKICFPGGY